MKYNEEWSKELQETSVDVLYNGKCCEPCRVKHFRKENRFGSVSVVEGITYGKWVVDLDSGETEEFDSVEKMVESGWVID